jgi:hypothetical protein
LYFHFAPASHPRHNCAEDERTRIATRRSLAIVCDILELILVCFGLLVREKSVGVGITMVCKIILQKRLLVHKHSTDAKTQFAILYRPLRTICSRPLSLHDRSDHLCRDSKKTTTTYTGLTKTSTDLYHTLCHFLFRFREKLPSFSLSPSSLPLACEGIP